MRLQTWHSASTMWTDRTFTRVRRTATRLLTRWPCSSLVTVRPLPVLGNDTVATMCTALYALDRDDVYSCEAKRNTLESTAVERLHFVPYNHHSRSAGFRVVSFPCLTEPPACGSPSNQAGGSLVLRGPTTRGQHQ